MTETISNFAKQNNLKVIAAQKFNSKYVQSIDDQYFLIYDWYNGDMLYNYEITPKNIVDIAEELAKFHKLKVLKNARVRKNKKINFKKYLNLLMDIDEEWAKKIKDNYSSLLEVYNKSYESYLLLSNQKSFIHGDLSSKNILLVDNKIYMIDWETAKIGNPSIDFFYTSWFGIGEFNKSNYYCFCKTYLSHNKLLDDINISSYASLTEEFAWLELCLKRSLGIQTNDDYEIGIGKNSAIRSLDRILKCYNNIPKMLEIIEKIKKELNSKN